MTHFTVELFKLIYIFTASIGIWSVFQLITAGRQTIHQFFALFLALLNCPLLLAYFQLLDIPTPKLLLAVCHSLILLYGPLLFHIIRSINGRPLSSLALTLQLSPYLLLVLSKLSGWFYLSPHIILSFCAVQISGYAYLCIQTLRKNKPKSAHDRSNYAWLVFLSTGILAFASFDLTVISYYLLVGSVNGLYWNAILSLLACYMLCIAIISLLKPDLFYFRTASDICKNFVDQQRIIQSVCQKLKPEVREISQELADSLTQQLQQLMQQQQVFRQNGLSLNDLAKQLNISKHQLSELLNCFIKQSFYDYVNTYRVEYAANLLANPDCHDALIDVAFAAGFNNKNSFYRCFKQTKQLTPSQYRKAQTQQIPQGITRSNSDQ